MVANDITDLLGKQVLLPQELHGNKTPAKCLLYDPLSTYEGTCMPSPNQNVVSRLGGCDRPEDCRIFLDVAKQKYK